MGDVFDELIQQYGGANKPSSTPGGGDVFDDLINKYGTGKTDPQYAKPAEPEHFGTFWDFVKHIPGGIAGGLASTASALGKSTAIEMGQPPEDIPSPTEVKSAFEHAAGEKPTIGGVHQAVYGPDTRAGKAGEAVGEALGTPSSWIGPGGVVAKGISATTSALGSEIGGQLTEGTKAEPLVRTLGSIFGGLFPKGVAKTITPLPASPDRMKAVEFLRSEGIEPQAGQVTGRRALRYAEASLGGAPFAGGVSERETERIAGQFTRAVNRRMGVDANKALPEVIRRVRKDLGQQFERSTKNLRVRFDQKYFNDIADWVQEILKEGLPEQDTNRIIQQARNLAGGFVSGTPGQRPYMSGTTYHSLTKFNSALERAVHNQNSDVAYFSTKLRSILDDALERTATGQGTQAGKGMRKALDEFRDARRKWYNMIVISKAATGAGEATPAGFVSPQKLRQILTASEDKKLQYAAGKGDLHDLARAGEAILTTPRTSGTAERAFVHAIPASLAAAGVATVAGEPLAIPAFVAGAAAPGVVGRALSSGPAQVFLKNQALSKLIRKLPPKHATAVRSIIQELSRSEIEQLSDGGTQ